MANKNLRKVVGNINNRINKYKNLVIDTKNDIMTLNTLKKENEAAIADILTENVAVDVELTRATQFIEAVTTAFGIQESANG